MFLWCDLFVNILATDSFTFHQIVYYQEHVLSSVKLCHVREALSKIDVVVLAKRLLLLSVTVDYSARWRVYYATNIVYEL